VTPCDLCALVRPNRFGGYPTEYVVARIKSRQASLIRDWESVLRMRSRRDMSDEQVWSAMLAEFGWLHRQLNPSLLWSAAPMFALFELKTLALVLRNIAIRRASVVRSVLNHSLLDEQLQAVLLRAADVRSALVQLAQLGVADWLFSGLEAFYDQGKLRAIEEEVMTRFLERAATSRLEPALAEFFRFFIDLSNIMRTYKHVRWELAAEPRLIAGGSIPTARLRQIASTRDSALLTQVVQQATGHAASPTEIESRLETILLKALTDRLAARRRDDRAINVVISYLWRRYIQARNLAVLVHGADVAVDVLEHELIA
jgi:vacuolar-type H+-ATPase subunit C/Vma6